MPDLVRPQAGRRRRPPCRPQFAARGPRGLAWFGDADSPEALLARLTAEGLITGDDAVELTEAGAALFERLRDHVLGATVNLLREFDLSEVETTVRTCKAIMRQAPPGEAASRRDFLERSSVQFWRVVLRLRRIGFSTQSRGPKR